MDQTLTSAARERSPSFTKAAFGFLGSLTVINLGYARGRLPRRLNLYHPTAAA